MRWAAWIEECTSYYRHCVFTLDQFHVARELKRYVGHMPKTWETVRKSIATIKSDTLFYTLASVPETKITEKWQEDWRKYREFLERHREHLRDYRGTLRKAGIDTSGMRPMGSAESQMRIMAIRRKGGEYRWSVWSVQAMLKTIMKSKEGHSLTNWKGDMSQNVLSVKSTISPVVTGSETRVERVLTGRFVCWWAPCRKSNRSSLKRIVRGHFLEKYTSQMKGWGTNALPSKRGSKKFKSFWECIHDDLTQS